jgi:polyhydroxyalkanoate synthesis repressor PhaR
MHKIKRYANRKLYDTTDKNYIRLDQISGLIKAGQEISVVDNQTGEDLTSATISQILARDKKLKNGDMVSSVLIQLLRKGGGTLVDYGKKYVSLWESGLTLAEDEIDKLVNRLVKDKELSESEGSKLKKDISGRADDLKKWIGDKIDQQINHTLNLMNLATKEQVTNLTAKIDSLTKKVEKLERLNNKKVKKQNSKVTELKKKGRSIQKDQSVQKERKTTA